MDGFGKGPFGTKLSIAAQVTNGVCPTCSMEGVFVSLTPEIYRCITCGADCRQYINGHIKYIPAIAKVPELTLNGHKT